MELDEFITNSLLSISKGLRKANEELARLDNKELGKDASSVFTIKSMGSGKDESISFDIAVSVNSETTKNGGGSIKIAVVNLSGDASSISSQQSTSRIKFNVSAFKFVS